MRRLTVRRPTSVVLAATLLAVLLALALLSTAAPAAAEGALGDHEVVLAVDGPVGPEPQPREAETNPAGELRRYENQETQFTWGAAWLLTIGGGVALVLLGLLYELLVRRPEREAAGKK